MYRTFGYDYSTAASAADQAIAAYRLHGGYLLRYESSPSLGVLVVSDALDDGAAVLMPCGRNAWVWLTDHRPYRDDVEAAIKDMDPEVDPSPEDVLDGSMRASDWFEGR